MKKLLFAAFMVISMQVSAQILDHIKIQPRAAFDVAPTSNGFSFSTPVNVKYLFGHYRTRIGIEISLHNLSIEFDNSVYMLNDGKAIFTPTRTDYIARLSYNIGNDIKISAEHMCMHPVVSASTNIYMFSGGHTAFSISYGY